MGANGAGKTTIISIITGLVFKSGGQVEVFGIDTDEDHEAAKRMIGVVPQEFNFNVFEKVEDIIMTQAGYYGIPRKKAKQETRSKVVKKPKGVSGRDEAYKIKDDRNVFAEELREMLKDPDDVRKAVVVSEILKRKY